MQETSNNQEIILVTGGSGLVGKAIQQYISDKGVTDEGSWIFVSSKEADLSNFDQTWSLFNKHKPTQIIHLAAMVGGLFHNLLHNVEFFRINTKINDNVLACAKEFKVKKCVSCLSTCIFPDRTSYPIDETMIHNGPPHHSNEGYAVAKRNIDVLNRLYNSEYGCNFTSVIPTNIYGPFDNFNLDDGHVIPVLIHKCYLAKKTNTDFIISGTGKALRQFVYASDLAALFVWVLHNYESVHPIILSVDESAEVSIEVIAKLIAKAMDYPLNRVSFDTSKADGQLRKTASNSKLRALFPDFTFTPIEEGIRKTTDWFIANYETCRK